MPEEAPLRVVRTGITKEQKMGFILLLIFGILSVGLGFLQIRNSLYAPFALNNKVAVNVKDELNTVDALRLRDTDHDGLNDFEELYVYGTSPYLYDTFSYGLSDKEVIAKGLPLCPKGQDCSAIATSGEAALPGSASSTAAALGNDPTLANPPPDLLGLLNDPAQVRQLLIGAGMEKTILDKVSDAQLTEIVRQALSSTSTLEGIQTLNALVGAAGNQR